MSKSGDFIGFPENWLRQKPVRLPVLRNEADWFVVNKLAGLLPQAHPWYPDKSNLTQAIRKQAEEGKGELRRLGITHCYYVCGPECESPGPTLFAKTKFGSDHLKNAYGSNLIEFQFLFVTRSHTSDSELNCELPVGQHRDQPKAVISHKYGKKASTRFRKVSESDFGELWEATTTHPRYHQIRLHAAELGIPVFGDGLYGEQLIEKEMRPRGRAPRAFLPRFSGLALLLSAMDLSRSDCGGGLFRVPPSKPFALMLRKCGLELPE